MKPQEDETIDNNTHNFREPNMDKKATRLISTMNGNRVNEFCNNTNNWQENDNVIG